MLNSCDIDSLLDQDETNINLNNCFYIIKHYREDANLTESNFNLILVFKKIFLSSDDWNEFYMSTNDMLFTWSFRLHFMLNEELIKPLLELKSLHKSLSSDENTTNLKFNFLIESNILVNFLFDYSSQEESPGAFQIPYISPSSFYYNTCNSNNYSINTLSIILNQFYLDLTDFTKLNLVVDDIAMFINIDDQNINPILFQHTNQNGDGKLFFC